MLKKDSLFYMANFDPEIGRMFRAYDAGKKETADQFRDRSLKIIDTILNFTDVKPAGKEEWGTVRNLVEGYDKLDIYSRKVLGTFGQPFSIKFMNQYSAGMAGVS
jgi:hypothetical protein